MGYLIVGLLGFALGATKGDDLDRSMRTETSGSKRWTDY